VRRKNRFVYCAVLSLLLSLFVQNTLAYFTATGTAHNVITSGIIDIALEETSVSDEILADVDNIIPGDVISKIVTVTNNDMPVYVRVKCDSSVRNAAGELQDLPPSIQMDFDTDNWTCRDGWWYYNQPLGIGESTLPLFTQIEFAEGKGNEYAACDIQLDVLAQATQVANNGTDVFTAAGWPEI